MSTLSTLSTFPIAVRKIDIILGICGILFLGLMGGGCVAYFVSSSDSAGVWYDGFGRPLSESPFFMRFIFGQERLWPGWGWFFADMAIFWGGMLTVYALGSWAVSLGGEDSTT